MFLLEHGSGPCRALALALQCLILPDHVGVQQGLQACVPVAGSLGQDTVVGKLERQRGVNAEGVEIHTCARIRSWAPRA